MEDEKQIFHESNDAQQNPAEDLRGRKVEQLKNSNKFRDRIKIDTDSSDTNSKHFIMCARKLNR